MFEFTEPSGLIQQHQVVRGAVVRHAEHGEVFLLNSVCKKEQVAYTQVSTGEYASFTMEQLTSEFELLSQLTFH